VWQYIKSAYMVGVDVPALGRLPVNVLLTIAFVILGFAEPAFWLAGLGVQSTIVAVLAFNSRFQKYVQSQQLIESKDEDAIRRVQLIQILEPEARRKLSALGLKCNKIIDVYRSQQTEDYVVETNRDALDRLQWNYLKLLVARHHIISIEGSESEQGLQSKIASLELDLKNDSAPESLRQSKAATLAILRKRLANFSRRSDILQEIDSDCTRIEAQVDLILENATMQGKPETISTDIVLASDLIGAGVFGDDEDAVTHLERKFGSARPQAEAS